MKQATFDNVTVAIFLLLVLFLPKSNELSRLYFAALLVATPFLIGSIRKLCFDYMTLIGIGILISYLIVTLLRFVFIVDPNLRDYTEFARLLLPVLFLVFRNKFKSVKIDTVFYVFAFYVSIDFTISILDFLNIDSLGIVSFTNSLYVSDVHAAASYRISGLSPGPGQHGILMIVIFIFFYCRAFQSKKAIFPLLFSLFAAFPLFVTQSRTSLIGFAIVGTLVPLFYLLFGNSLAKRRSVPILTLIIGGGTFLLIKFQDFFSRFLDLLEGLDRVTSYQDRLEGYEMLIEKAMEHPAFLVLGYGKDYFTTGTYDNEYLMMFLIYGPVISLIFLIGIMTYLAKFSLKKNKMQYHYGTIIFFMFAVGLLFAYPSAFFLQPSTIPILFSFISFAYWEKHRIETRGLAEM